MVIQKPEMQASIRKNLEKYAKIYQQEHNNPAIASKAKDEQDEVLSNNRERRNKAARILLQRRWGN